MEDDVKNIIAPSALEIESNYLKLGEKFVKTLFVLTYPRYLSASWLSPVIDIPELVDISLFFHPESSGTILRGLERNITYIEAQISEREEKGYVRDPALETAKQDIETLRDNLLRGEERFFRVGLYFSLYADTQDALQHLEAKVTSLLEGHLVYAKPAIFQQMEGLTSTFPFCMDTLFINTPMNSSPASSIFPFISADLTTEEGILYGVNRQNNTLIIFDRFSLENANMVIFAKSGAGKSYAAKLEALRSLMMGIGVIVIDPESEYESLANAVGGSFFKISLSSEHTINPFDIPVIPEDEDASDALKSHISGLVGLIKVMVGEVSPEEDAVLDRAITETYATHDIAPGKDFSQAEVPLLEDLERILENMEGGRGLSKKLNRFTKGTYAGFTNRITNIDLESRFTAFSLRDLEEGLRPIAMYIILNFVWNVVKVKAQRRIMIIDDAWWLMKYPDGAAFLFAVAKRCRKYDLGLTTITQDVEDFLGSQYGRPIITNSSLQLLLKQAPAMMESITKTFALSDPEKTLLLSAPVGQGLFFAGYNHVMIQVIASYAEDRIIAKGTDTTLHLEANSV